ncbi:hypothetical protein BB561_002747 [Smittium simulii]|uniref:Ubiquitin-activating enzyme E1-like n=1 Tax=Smittium simulii TaxID=133385 RepID=A0A2T9YP99_9FUNG|nr:hypothetical protein BB561_002747 [Smittium simulii]
MSGFSNITLIDLDTIELSNLNRQFLFKKKHIGLPKAQVAAQAIHHMSSSSCITPIVDNIKASQFDALWFETFDIAINALDNLDARRHVNLMCQAAKIPLIETGTAGYVGQTTVIQNNLTECFECQPKPVEQKTFPVCTIRNTPSSMIHCVVWAKDYLFSQIFGDKSENSQYLDSDDPDDSKMIKEAENLSKLIESITDPNFQNLLFDSVFGYSIQVLLELDKLWESRQKPTCLYFDSFLQSVPSTTSTPTFDLKQILDINTCFQIWCSSLKALVSRSQITSLISFDKDDSDALQFVASSANIRAHIFGIPNESIFQIKAMAGNIIPAIATTNAIIAGIAVMQAIKVVSGNIANCKTVYYTYGGNRPQYLYKEPLLKPNPDCSICQAKYFLLSADFSTVKLQDLVSFIQTYQHNICSDEYFSLLEGNRILYDPDFQDNLPKTLESLNVFPGTILSITPEDDHQKGSFLCAVKRNGNVDQSLSIELSGNSKLDTGSKNLVPQKRKIETSPDAVESKKAESLNGTTSSTDQQTKSSGNKQLLIDLDSNEQNTVYLDDD